jgi:hypothetical protein
LDFLEAELAVENLFFYEDCVMFKRKIENQVCEEEINQLVRSIRDTFARSSAPYSVNISYETREVLLTELASGKFGKQMFDEAQSQILRLMARDAFLRFQQSSAFTKIEMTHSLAFIESHTTDQTLLSKTPEFH